MDEFLIACELHSVDRLRAVLDAGLDPTAPIRGRPRRWAPRFAGRSRFSSTACRSPRPSRRWWAPRSCTWRRSTATRTRHASSSRSASADIHLAGLTWGRGFEWETTFFDVTPISYAQAGLLPQMHRDERDVYDTTRALLTAAGPAVPPLANVPNRYVGDRR